MSKTKTSKATLEARDKWMRHVWIVSDNGSTIRRIENVTVFDAGETVCTFRGTDIHDAIKANGYSSIELNTAIKWNTRKAPDLSADHAHMVRAETVWNDAAYTLYIPAEYAHTEELEPRRNGEYMVRRYRSTIFGKCESWTKFPGFDTYGLHKVFEEAAKSYEYTGLKIATEYGRAYMDAIIQAIESAYSEAVSIVKMSDQEFFEACKEA